MDTAELLRDAKNVVIVPGYGMAVAQAQHRGLRDRQPAAPQGAVRFAIHPVAGRMPGHMNVLLAEAKVPTTSCSRWTRNQRGLRRNRRGDGHRRQRHREPGRPGRPGSPIAGMPVLEVWKARTSIVMKRSMASGYAGVDNPLFYKENNRTLFGDARKMLDEVLVR